MLSTSITKLKLRYSIPVVFLVIVTCRSTLYTCLSLPTDLAYPHTLPCLILCSHEDNSHTQSKQQPRVEKASNSTCAASLLINSVALWSLLEYTPLLPCGACMLAQLGLRQFSCLAPWEIAIAVEVPGDGKAVAVRSLEGI